jgi:hypothetical protein
MLRLAGIILVLWFFLALTFGQFHGTVYIILSKCVNQLFGQHGLLFKNWVFVGAALTS